MGGPKSQGQILEGSVPRGLCTSASAKINFAIPSTLLLETADTVKQKPKPGILHEGMNLFSETSEVVKVAFDAKKINSSPSCDQGDVDLFGNEEPPTLKDKEERKNTELNKLEEPIRH